MTNGIPNFDDLPLTLRQVRDLRSDHAGEAGAVRLYDGILAVSRDPDVRRFAKAHRVAEQRHLAFFDDWLPAAAKSRLLPLWRSAGWILGATAAMFGRVSVFRTIAAVETFVDGHYREQIDSMRDEPRCEALVARLEAFRAEEIHHRDDAAHRLDRGGAPVAGFWPAVVGVVSSMGAAVARRL